MSKNYYYDTEFLEGKQDKRFLGIKYGETKPTIDLISIGIVCEDGRELYEISKDFNLREAWNRYDLKWEQTSGDMRNHFPNGRTYKVYWIRENVLKPIFIDLWIYDLGMNKKAIQENNATEVIGRKMTYNGLKYLLKKHGKTNKEIAEDVKDFCITYDQTKSVQENNPEFYTYYGAYDHVALCWLFGKMIDLPKGFPMYSYDLKQLLDEKQANRNKLKEVIEASPELLSKHEKSTLIEPINLKDHTDYPKQENEHSALHDARWNKQLHEFLKTI